MEVSEVEAVVDFQSLPTEIKAKIFSLLPFEDITNALTVCSDWNDIFSLLNLSTEGSLVKTKAILIGGKENGRTTVFLESGDRYPINKTFYLSLESLSSLGPSLLLTTKILRALWPVDAQELTLILENCSQLVDISANYLTQSLDVLVPNNAETLSRLFIHTEEEDPFEADPFDCGILTDCRALNKLTIHSPLKNVHLLPSQLATLHTSQLSKEDVVWILRNLKALEYLEFRAPHDHNGKCVAGVVTTDILKNLLELPQIKEVDIIFETRQFKPHESYALCEEVLKFKDCCNEINEISARAIAFISSVETSCVLEVRIKRNM